MSESPTRTRPVAAFAGCVAATLAAGLAAVVIDSAPAGAATARAPIGAATSSVTTSASGSVVTFTGWALDQDAPATRAVVVGLLDGYQVSAAPTSRPNAAVTSRYRANALPGLVTAVSVPKDGRSHSVCLGVRNLGGGLASVLRCTTVAKSLRPVVTSHSPFGTARAARKGTLVTFTGRATDPDYRDRPLAVTLYVDGRKAAATITRNGTGSRATGTGVNSSYKLAARVTSRRAHTACVRATDVGPGGTTTLACKQFELKSHKRNGLSSTERRRQAAVVKLARKQFNKPYVWAAEGPKSFDCSGLVQWTYRKNKLGLTPRVAQDQFAMARIIPAAKARAGDLVFYYDQRGYVHHVGIFVRPGMTIAAMSPRLGIGYQPVSMTPGIDGSGVSYGSFTHS